MSDWKLCPGCGARVDDDEAHECDLVSRPAAPMLPPEPEPRVWTATGMYLESDFNRHKPAHVKGDWIPRDQFDLLRQAAERLARGEFICSRCGIRKDGENEPANF